MTEYISVHCIDLYNVDKLKAVIQDETKEGLVNVVYFSGSFSLLPDPKGALLSVVPFLRTKTRAAGTSTTGLVYITQTYQKRVIPLLSNLKPLLKYLTTIDFGQLVKVDEIYGLLNDEELVQNKLILKEHSVIEGSLDNYWQAAYLSVLEVENGQAGAKGTKKNDTGGKENKKGTNFWDGWFKK